MAQTDWTLLEPRETRDVACILRVLHRVGPLQLQDLVGQPELAGWSPQRMERAVVSAWSRTLIFIDNRDLLVAI